MRYFIAVAFLALCGVASAHPTASELDAQIEKEGAKAVLAKLFNAPELESYIYKRISSGSAASLKMR